MRTVERSSSVVAALVTLARRLRARCPALLLVGGLALGAIPRIPRVEVAPDCVLLLVLPPIVCGTAFLTAIPRFRTNLAHIPSRAIVLARTVAVASVAVSLVPGMTVPIAIVLLQGEILLNVDSSSTRRRGEGSEQGFEVDMTVHADVGALARVWTGHVAWAEAVRSGGIKLEGPMAIVRAFPGWLQLSHFASVLRPTHAG